MALVIGLLTLLLVLNSLILILLVLVQLPKKESGAGLAFGGGTSDALFGAGSGTVLSRITKYGCGLFLLLSLTLSVLYTHAAKEGRQGVLRELERQAGAAVAVPAVTATNITTPVLQPVSTNPALPVAPLPVPTNALPATAAPTNAVAAPPATNAPATPPPGR